jgi:hypothetical protein
VEKEMQRFLRKIVFCSILFLHSFSAEANLTFANQDAKFTVSGGSLNIVNPISNWNGTLRVISGFVTGNSINFNEGGFRNAQGALETTGKVYPQKNPTIVLSGNQKVTGAPGVVINSLQVLGSGNILVGQPDFLGTTTLLNSFSELQLNITNRLGQSILMNNGLITLLNDLTLGDNTVFTGSGRVNLNYRTLRLPAKETTWTSQLYFTTPNDIILSSKTSLSGKWTFDGVGGVLQGNGNILDLTSGGTLWIKSGADVEFTDIHIRGLGNIYGSIVFEDATSQIRLSNATLQLASNYSVTEGSIYVEGANSLIITGTSTLTIVPGAIMTVDRVTCFADALDVTATVNISPNIPDDVTLFYKNNGILKASGGGDGSLAIANSNAIVGWVKNTSNVMVSTYNLVVQTSSAVVFANSLAVFNSNAIRSVSRGVAQNSNAIVGWIRNTSNAMSGLVVAMSDAIVSSVNNPLNVDNSNAIVGWIQDTSNVMISTYNLVVQSSNAIVQSSNAIVFAHSLAVFNSNAIRAVSRGVTHNSNAIVSWIKDTSNVMVSTYNLVVQSSNAIVQSSNAIVFANSLAVFNSNAIRAISRGVANNSNAIVGWIRNTSNAVAGLMVDMSNSIVSMGGNALSVDNSNALVSWVLSTSNAVAGLMVDMSNSIVSGGGNALSIDNSVAIVGWIRNTSRAMAGLVVDMSNSIVSMGGNALAVDNSNAIVGWIKDTSNNLVSTYNLLAQTSNGVVATNNLAIANSNAIIGWIKDTSNNLVSTYNLLVQTSNAEVATNNLAIANSNAITGWVQDTSNVVNAPGGNALSVANSNAIVGWIKDTSNAINGLLVVTSNAVAGLLVDTSNAVNNLRSLVVASSNAITGWIQDTSNNLVSTYNLLIQTSNAVVATNNLAVASSNAITGWIQDTSNVVTSPGGNALSVANSNAIVSWIKDTSEAVNNLRPLVVANSNAITGWIQDTSNNLVSTYNLLVQTSNAVVATNNLAVASSNAITGWIQDTSNVVTSPGGNALSVANSNAIVSWIKDTSNTVAGLLVDMSNSIVASGGNALSIANSNAIVSWIKDTSNVVAGLLIDMSNAIVASGGNALSVANSNAIVGWIKDTSNNLVSTYNLALANSYGVINAHQLAVDSSWAMLSFIASSSAAGPLLIATSNAVHWARALADGIMTIDHGPSHIHMNAAMTLSYDIYLSADHQFFGHVSDVCDGAGHVINFAKNSSIMMTIDPGMTVTFENIRLKGYADKKISLGIGSDIYFGNNCEIELDDATLIEKVWKCLGNVKVYGNGHQLSIFDDSTGIVVGPASQVLFSHLTLSGIEAARVRCMSNECSLIFNDVDLVLSNDYTFTVGSMRFQRDVIWTSTMQWRYESPMSSTIDSYGTLIFDKRFVWKYYPSISTNYAFIFTDSSSVWKLNGNDIFISATGLQLIRGTMIIDDANSFYCDGSTLSEALIIGNGVAADDFSIEVLPAAEFTLETGILDYQNMS